MTYFAVRMADKPADRDHQYGHGKIENIAALAETALLFILSGVVMWELARRLIGDQSPRGGGHRRRVRRDRRLHRRRLLSCPRAHARRRRYLEPRPGGRRAAFQLGHVVVGGRPHRSRRRAARLPLRGFGRRHGGGAVRVPGWLAARPPHHRRPHRHRSRRCRRPHHRHRQEGRQRRLGRARAHPPGRRHRVRRDRRGREPHPAARPHRGDEGGHRRRGQDGAAQCRDRRQRDAARPRRRDRDGAA